MRHVIHFAIAAVAALCAAAPLGATAAAPSATTAAIVIDVAKPPLGWADFCARNAGDCMVLDAPARDVVLTESAWRTLVAVNARVNRAVSPLTDMEQFGQIEHWDYPRSGKGDCEDYVLLKRRQLIDAGFPRQALLVTVVIDQKGEGHAVLTVKTDRGDFVLDNQNARVLPWRETGYRFVKRQSQENPNRWVSLGDPGRPTATAGR